MGCAFYVFHENNIKGVLTNGKVIQVSKECYDNLQYGNCCQSVTIQINKNGTEKIIRVSELFYNFDDAVKGNREDAPGEFVEENLKWGMRDGSRHSITAYEINEIQVEPGVGFDPIVFTVKYSITPARYATGFKAYHQYLPDRDGPVPAITGLTQRIILLYIDKRWIPYSDNAGLYFSCFDEIPTPNLNETEYQDESGWLFETEHYTYRYERIYDQEENDSGPKQYTFTLKRKDKTKGGEIIIWEIRSHCVYFLATYGDDLYFSLEDDREWEWFEAGFIRISDITGEVVRENASYICAVDDGLIYCGKNIRTKDDTNTVLQIFSMKDKKFIGVWKDVIVYYIDCYFHFTVEDGILIWDDYTNIHHFDYKTGIDIIKKYGDN